MCGYVLVGIESAGEAAWLLGLAVARRKRGLGFGGILLDKAFAISKQAGVERVLITVRPTDAAAIHLYEQAGFRQDGGVAESYFGAGEPRAVLRREFSDLKLGTNA